MLTCRIVCIAGLAALSSCATSSATNYSVAFRATGPANDVAEKNNAAERAFKNDVTDLATKQAISAVKVFLDSIPAEITLKDNAVAIRDGDPAVLLGSVEITAIWKAPSDDAEVLPAMQKAAYAVGANMAFCPRNEKPAFHTWRCYLVQASH
jgi:hypothetical protein